MASRGIASAARTMRAAVLPRFGGPDVIEIRHVPIPRCTPDEVLVRMQAASINPLDLRVREGYGRSIYEGMLPLVLGRDISGEVVDAGPGGGLGRGPFAPGAEVFGVIPPQRRWGTHAEFAAVPRKYLQPKPSGMRHEDAAAIPFAAMTAWRALQNTGGLKPRQRVLLLGGGGAVGACALALAKSAGAVVAVACGPSSAERLREGGADLVLEHSGRGGGLRRAAREAGAAPFDVVIDLVGTEESERAGVRLLQPGGGRYTTLHGSMARLADKYGLIAGGAAAAMELHKKRAEYEVSPGVEFSWSVMRPDEEGMHATAALAAAGRLVVPVVEDLPLEHAGVAHGLLEGGGVRGKVVLTAPS